jgi:hypothetical protein
MTDIIILANGRFGLRVMGRVSTAEPTDAVLDEITARQTQHSTDIRQIAGLEGDFPSD